MNLLDLVTEPYNRRARLQPALLTLLPLFLVPLVLYPEVETRSATALAVLAYFGGVALFTQVGRDRGKSNEPALFAKWNGMPSVALLRHSNATLADPTKKRYHAFLARAVPNYIPPKPEDEAQDSGAADEMYRTATDWLLTQSRDRKRFALVFEENMNYGFRRNLWALRPIAIGLNVLLIAAISIFHFATHSTGEIIFDLGCSVAAAIVLVHGLLMFFLVTANWVRATAVAYARQLLAVCDALGASFRVTT